MEVAFQFLIPAALSVLLLVKQMVAVWLIFACYLFYFFFIPLFQNMCHDSPAYLLKVCLVYVRRFLGYSGSQVYTDYTAGKDGGKWCP